MNILAIESSCDETACAIVADGTKIISSVVASSTQMHKKYGGIVPEVAAREQLTCILPVITEALKPFTGVMKDTINRYIDQIAVSVGPGLIGSLLVGVETAKTIAFVTGKPIIPVNHVLAHMYANFVNNGAIEFPALSLVVSGGHTELYLMKNKQELTWLGGTLDDAAGECFDKAARLLGLGTGGGLAIQQAAKKFPIGNFQFAIKLPRPMIHHTSLNFSFSGLKTALLRELHSAISHYDDIYHHSEHHEFSLPEDIIDAFAYEVQEAITDVLVAKTLKAVDMFGAKSILLSGGVAANLRLREKLSDAIAPPVNLCTDNAVYIASYAFFHQKDQDWHTITALPDLSVEI